MKALSSIAYSSSGLSAGPAAGATVRLATRRDTSLELGRPPDADRAGGGGELSAEQEHASASASSPETMAPLHYLLYCTDTWTCARKSEPLVPESVPPITFPSSYFVTSSSTLTGPTLLSAS